MDPNSFRVCMAILGMLALAGCPPGGDDDTSSTDDDDTSSTDDDDSADGVDADGDGWEASGDCDDGDPATHPGAIEVCDGVTDNDCDGIEDTDELDDDGDGHSECGGDCDDADASVFPGATEACNGVDDDCDGAIDYACDADCDSHVPGDYPTLQDAIDLSVSGEVVCVEPGTYHERLDFDGAIVHLYAVSGPEVTVIDGQEEGSVAVFNDGEGADTILEGFTVTNGWAYRGGGIYIYDSSPTLRNLHVFDNTTERYGGGMYVVSSQSLIEGVVVEDNWAGYSWDGHDCPEDDAFGGGLYMSSSDAVLTDCVFLDNRADSYCTGEGEGGGARINGGSPQLTRVLFEDSWSFLGSGLYLTSRTGAPPRCGTATSGATPRTTSTACPIPPGATGTSRWTPCSRT